tara:strand:- start:13582 stop:14034 length:453 start_codon:yes stop_codon:yes gene_type:complete
MSRTHPKFYVGHETKNGHLKGNGNFKTYQPAVQKAMEVSEREGNSVVLSPAGSILWGSKGEGLFQKGKMTTEAKRFMAEGGYDYATEYRAEGMNAGSMSFLFGNLTLLTLGGLAVYNKFIKPSEEPPADDEDADATNETGATDTDSNTTA